MSEWQPIETAPEKGSVLAYHPDDGINVLWRNNSGKWISTIFDYVETPTHWMPLPEAPQEKIDD